MIGDARSSSILHGTHALRDAGGVARPHSRLVQSPAVACLRRKLAMFLGAAARCPAWDLHGARPKAPRDKGHFGRCLDCVL